MLDAETREYIRRRRSEIIHTELKETTARLGRRTCSECGVSCGASAFNEEDHIALDYIFTPGCGLCNDRKRNRARRRDECYRRAASQRRMRLTVVQRQDPDFRERERMSQRRRRHGTCTTCQTPWEQQPNAECEACMAREAKFAKRCKRCEVPWDEYTPGCRACQQRNRERLHKERIGRLLDEAREAA